MYPLIIKDFISKESVDTVYTWTINNINLFGELNSRDFWTGRSIRYHQMPKNIQDIINGAFQKCINLVCNNEILVPDLQDITRWPEGYELHPHADAEEPNGQRHQYWWRKFGAIIYLNNDFIGGELYYPNLDITVKPEAGMLAVHPGTLTFLHGVKPVIGNTRYTLTSFFKNP